MVYRWTCPACGKLNRTEEAQSRGRQLCVACGHARKIQKIHQRSASELTESARLYIFLPVAAILLGLWVSGLYLWFLPWSIKWRRVPTPPSATAK